MPCVLQQNRVRGCLAKAAFAVHGMPRQPPPHPPPPLLPTQASHTAAHTFQQLCLRCSWKLRDAASFGWLLEAAHGALAQAGPALPIADRQLVVEGVARVAAGLQGQQLLDAAAAVTAPFVQAAAAAAGGGGNGGGAPGGAARRALADSLRLLASAVRHLAPAGDDRGALGAQPAAAVLSAAAPTLRAVAESPAWQADTEAISAVVEVYHRAVGTAKQHGLQVGCACVGLCYGLCTNGREMRGRAHRQGPPTFPLHVAMHGLAC